MGPWYFEYEVTIVDSDMSTSEDIRQGVICGDSFSEVASFLEDYYGMELIRINKLSCITDCSVYEFNGPDTEFNITLEEAGSND